MSIITAPSPTSSWLTALRFRPWKVVAVLLPAGIAAQITIDWMLGETAEYYNAFALVEAWGQLLSAGRLDAGHEFIMGQQRMGIAPSMAIGTGLLVIEPAVVLTAIVFSVSQVARRFNFGT